MTESAPSNDFRVPVKTWIKASTYRVLLDAAREHHVPDVGTLLERLAERSVTTTARTSRRWVRMTDERILQMHKLLAAGKSKTDIARALGVSPSTISNYTKGK